MAFQFAVKIAEWAAGAIAAVAGTKTPADAMANPTDCQDVLAFNALWNGATWDRWAATSWSTSAIAVAGSPTNSIYTRTLTYGWDGGANYKPLLTDGNGNLKVSPLAGVTYAEAAFTANASNSLLAVTSFGNARNKQSASTNTTKTTTCDSAGAQFVRRGAPDPAASTVTDTATTSTPVAASTEAGVVAGVRDLVQVRASNDTAAKAFLVIGNKATALVNGDAVIWPIMVPPGSSVPEMFDLPLHFSLGIAWAWSSTSDVVTLIADALNSNVVFSYK